MDKLIESIIKNKTECFFISPHLDDAAFSAGELMIHLAGKVNITVINVFTSAGDEKNTLSARAYLKQCKSNNLKILYQQRINEDKIALSTLGAKIYNLGYTDALWRKKRSPGKLNKFFGKYIPEFDRIYPTYKFNVVSGKVGSEDEPLKTEITRKIEFIIGKGEKNTKIFCPVGFGDHVDHLITRDICNKSFGNSVIYWSDFPYSLRSEQNQFIKNSNFDNLSLEIKSDKKQNLCELYSSQVNQVIRDRKTLCKSESFYINKIEPKKIQVVINKLLTDQLYEDWLSLWNNSQEANYVNSPYWFLSVIETFKYKDYVVVAIYEDKQLAGVLTLIKQKKYGVDFYTVLPGDFVCGLPFLLSQQKQNLVKSLLETLLGIGNIFMDNIPEQFANHLEEMTPHMDRIYQDFNYFLTFEKDINGQIVIKDRKKLMHRAKQVEKKFTLRSYTGNESQILDTVFEIDSKSRKKTRGYNVFSSNVMRRFYRTLAKRFGEYFSVHILYFENIPVAFRVGFVVNNIFFASQIAFSDKYRAYSPGNVLLVKFIEEFGIGKIKKVDFGSGNNEFKRTVSNGFRLLNKVVISKNVFIRNYIKIIYFSKDKVFKQMEKHLWVYSMYRNTFRKFM